MEFIRCVIVDGFSKMLVGIQKMSIQNFATLISVLRGWCKNDCRHSFTYKILF